MGSRSKQRRLLRGKPGNSRVSSGPIFLGGDLVAGMEPEPSAIDLLGDLAVSEEERKLRVQRREMPRFQLHTFDMVADESLPNAVPIIADDDPALDSRERRG